MWVRLDQSLTHAPLKHLGRVLHRRPQAVLLKVLLLKVLLLKHRLQALFWCHSVEWW